MKYCKKCVMPDTRPGIKFDERGIGSAGQYFENRKDLNWEARFKELTELGDIVDRLYNRDLFEKNEMGQWKLKNPIWEG